MSTELTLAGEVYQQLEQDILHLRVPPGAMLSENSLCERFSVSRTPIRSVLQRLAAERLVEIAPYRGTCVTKIHYNIVNQIIYQRVATESAIIRDFVGVCSPQELVQLRHCLALLEEERDRHRGGEEPNTARFYSIDKAMHEIWYRSTHKLYLWDSVNAQKADYIRFCMLDMQGGANYDGVVEEHRAMVDAVENRDLEAIAPVVRRHFDGGVRRLGTRVFTDLKDYFHPDSMEG